MFFSAVRGKLRFSKFINDHPKDLLTKYILTYFTNCSAI